MLTCNINTEKGILNINLLKDITFTNIPENSGILSNIFTVVYSTVSHNSFSNKINLMKVIHGKILFPVNENNSGLCKIFIFILLCHICGSIQIAKRKVVEIPRTKLSDVCFMQYIYIQ